MAEKVNLQQQIQQYRQSNPELKNFSDEQILSIMVQNGQITLTKAQQQCIFSNNTTEPNLAGLSFERISTPQIINTQEVRLKSTDGKTYNFNKTLQNRINNVSVNLQKAENENGFIGSAWSGFKNLTGIGDSSDKVREQLESEKNLLTQFNSNEQRRPQIFKELTGLDYTPENLEKFIKGEIKLKSEQALNGYKEGQEMAVDVIADVAAGVTSYAVASACIAGGIAAAPFTAGASLTGVAIGLGIAAGTGTVVKTGLKYADAKSGGREYTLDNAIYDSSTGAVSGALGIFTAGAGGAIGNSTKTLAVNALGKTALKEGAKQTIANATGFTATVVADGAIGGGVDNGFRTAIQGSSVGDVADATITGAGYGAVLGPVMGWGGKGVAKAGKEVVH